MERGRLISSLLDRFIKQTATNLGQPESMVELIIRDQWKYANKAARQLLEIEIAHLGTFYPSHIKIAKRYIHLFNKYHGILAVGESDPRTPKTLEDIREDILALQKTKNYDKAKRYMGKQAPYIVCDKEFGISLADS